MPSDPDEVESTVEQFLEGRPRAAEIAGLRAALERRLQGLQASLDREQDPAARARLQEEIATARKQVAALEREELITEFVEDSVRATASWSLVKPEEEEE